MNYIGHAFHFQQGDELFFQTQVPRPQPQQQQLQQTQQQALPQPQQINPGALVGASTVGLQPGSRRKLASSGANVADGEEADKVTKKKKIIHRDVERQRRHEMAMLYASLRFLLPIEYLKGKRSISDHMNEAANYIKDLQKKIKELTERRDGLRRVALGSTDNSQPSASAKSTQVVVRPSWAGAEVVISAGSTEGLPLSRVLEMLTEAGLDVVSCVSNNLNQMVVYTIESEVRDLNDVDLDGLQQKLIESFCPSN